MGDRAIIKPAGNTTSIYLHWHGEKDQVTALLEYCKLCGFRPFGGEDADDYGIARLCQVAGNWIGGSLSLGVCQTDGSMEDAGYLDNGIYVVDGWDIKERICAYDYTEYEEPISEEDLMGLLKSINAAQPIPLDENYVTAKVVQPSELKIGDKIYRRHSDRSSGAPCKIETCTISKISKDGPVTEYGVCITEPVRICAT